MSEVPNVSFSSNFLTVDGQELRALRAGSSDRLAVSAEKFSNIVASDLNRVAINSFIEEFYHRQLRDKPTQRISRPSVLAVQLATPKQAQGRTTSKVFTEKGWLKPGLRTERDDIRERFHGYMDGVYNAGYVPEAHKIGQGDVWLSVRRPTLPEVNEHWLQYDESELQQEKKLEVIERHISQPWDRESTQRAIRVYRAAGEIAIDRYSNSYGDTMRSAQQIGSILAVAALKNFVEDDEGYQAEASDALIYAQNDPTIHPTALRAIENSVYGTLE